MRFAQLIEGLGGRLVGDPDVVVERLARAAVGGPGCLGFAASAQAAYAFRDRGFAALIVPDGAPSDLADAVLLHPHPKAAFARAAAALLQTEAPTPGVDPLASVHPEAELGADCTVGPFAVIEAGAVLGARCVVGPGAVVGAGAELGADCALHARAVLYPRVVLGERVRVQAGAVLGAPGFGSVRVPEGWLDFPQVAGLRIGDDVVVGANTCIDGGALEPTVIEDQVRLDNLVQLAHGVRVGQRTAIAAQTGVGGSSHIGEDVLLAGQVGIADHVVVESGAALGGKTGVPSGVRLASGQWLGLPAMPMALASRVWAATRRLPSLRKRIAALEAEED